MKRIIFLIGILCICGNVFGNELLLRLERYVKNAVPAGFIRSDVNQYMSIDPDTEPRNGLEITMLEVERNIVNIAIYSRIFSSSREARQFYFELYDVAPESGWEYLGLESDQHFFMKNDIVLMISLDTEAFPGFYTVFAMVVLDSVF